MLRLSSAFLLCLFGVACKYGFISHFKGVFSAVYGVRVGLFGFGALRGLCGFCARVELGGLGACGVFASIYSFICLYLPFVLSLYLLLSSCPCVCSPFACPLLALSIRVVLCVFWVCGCFLFFPFGIYAKRKGAKCFCVLACPVVGVLFGCLWNYKTICSRFNPERVPSYPCDCEEIATIVNYLIAVSAFFLHHHTAIVVCACLFGAWSSVCLIKAINVAAVVGVDVCLCFLGVVV